MRKGFSSKKTELIFNTLISTNSDLTGSQICELGNRILEYGKDKQYQELLSKKDK